MHAATAATTVNNGAYLNGGNTSCSRPLVLPGSGLPPASSAKASCVKSVRSVAEASLKAVISYLAKNTSGLVVSGPLVGRKKTLDGYKFSVLRGPKETPYHFRSSVDKAGVIKWVAYKPARGRAASFTNPSSAREIPLREHDSNQKSILGVLNESFSSNSPTCINALAGSSSTAASPSLRVPLLGSVSNARVVESAPDPDPPSLCKLRARFVSFGALGLGAVVKGVLLLAAGATPVGALVIFVGCMFLVAANFSRLEIKELGRDGEDGSAGGANAVLKGLNSTDTNEKSRALNSFSWRPGESKTAFDSRFGVSSTALLPFSSQLEIGGALINAPLTAMCGTFVTLRPFSLFSDDKNPSLSECFSWLCSPGAGELGIDTTRTDNQTMNKTRYTQKGFEGCLVVREFNNYLVVHVPISDGDKVDYTLPINGRAIDQHSKNYMVVSKRDVANPDLGGVSAENVTVLMPKTVIDKKKSCPMTLGGFAEKWGCSVNELKELNPQLNGEKEGVYKNRDQGKPLADRTIQTSLKLKVPQRCLV